MHFLNFSKDIQSIQLKFYMDLYNPHLTKKDAVCGIHDKVYTRCLLSWEVGEVGEKSEKSFFPQKFRWKSGNIKEKSGKFSEFESNYFLEKVSKFQILRG